MKNSDMKIAVISTMQGAPWGGSEELWLAMAHEALNQGVNIAVSVERWSSMPPKILELQCRGARILHRYNNILFKLKNLLIIKLSYQTQPKLRQIARAIAQISPPLQNVFATRPQAICINQGTTFDCVRLGGFLERLYAAATPYVVICHFNDDNCFLQNTDLRETAIEFFSRAANVVFVSHQNLKNVERQLATSLPNAIVLRNPVNLLDISVVPWSNSKTLRMASVARLNIGHKGQDILFEALSSQRWRDRDWRLSLYGEGSERDYLEALARHYGIADRVEFCGHVRDVREIWSHNHLLVLPSRAEGTPLALVEAMLCGRPCVVTNVGGNTEWVEEPTHGFIAQAATASSFAAALERAWLAQADWQSMGIQAHERAMTLFDRTPGKTLLNVMLEAYKSNQSEPVEVTLEPLVS